MLGMPVLLPVSEASFDEAGYLAANPDLPPHVASGAFASGRDHFERYGKREPHRRMFNLASVASARRAKMPKIIPLLAEPPKWKGDKIDCLTPELRAASNIPDFDFVSSNPYEPRTEKLIEDLRDGILLDAGAGLRPIYYPNVVNLETADTASTDVLAVGEALPFKDNSFDAVISMCCLEHVKDPFKCASEMMRVLKPGGAMHCTVPFLQPVHGYPHHYYNMTPQGLRSLFERFGAKIETQDVPRYLLPIVTLTWFVRSWANGLPAKEQKAFLSQPLSTFMADWWDLTERNYVTALPDEKNNELACGTYLIAHKPH